MMNETDRGPFETGSSAAHADDAAAAAPGERKPGEDIERRQDKLLDEAVEETFPASDPISPASARPAD
ncbi:hypothetical protein [Sphingosinicella sp. BN140058]|uniref:hypothetical protein n=1 Tax=Sphingosinicella sp. BN140058 TaxID=1892855 RepID=UPI001011BD77|nr:hypothetical protein [Sphingosinicella sp. BN140058]QAY75303.1 hypothetical protein ETR14_01230 [Sphingosinicella sp. BN140058]